MAGAEGKDNLTTANSDDSVAKWNRRVMLEAAAATFRLGNSAKTSPSPPPTAITIEATPTEMVCGSRNGTAAAVEKERKQRAQKEKLSLNTVAVVSVKANRLCRMQHR